MDIDGFWVLKQKSESQLRQQTLYTMTMDDWGIRMEMDGGQFPIKSWILHHPGAAEYYGGVIVHVVDISVVLPAPLMTGQSIEPRFETQQA